MNLCILGILLILVVLFAVLCCMMRDLLYVAVSLAAGSAILAGILFYAGASIAGAFELSVCAGLITVLFVSTVSLTKNSDQKDEARFPAWVTPIYLAISVGLVSFITRWFSQYVVTTPTDHSSDTFANTFWNVRATDILGQICLVLTGVFGILALFRMLRKEHQHE